MAKVATISFVVNFLNGVKVPSEEKVYGPEGPYLSQGGCFVERRPVFCRGVPVDVPDSNRRRILDSLRAVGIRATPGCAREGHQIFALEVRSGFLGLAREAGFLDEDHAR